MQRALVRLLALLVVPALGLGACSDDGDDESGTGTGTATGSEPAADDGGDADDEDVDDGGELDLSAEEQEYADALASTLQGAAPEVADCFAGSIVQVLGVDAFTDADVTPADIEAEGSGLDLSELGVEEPSDEQAEEIGTRIDGCADLVEFFVAFGGTGLEQPQRACLEEELTEDFVREFLVAALKEPDADEPPAELQDEIDRIDGVCETDL